MLKKYRKWIVYSTGISILLSIAIFVMNKQVQHEAIEYDKRHPIHMTTLQNGEVEIISEGKELYSSLINDIHKARERVYMQFFIIRYDEQTKRLLKALEEAALRGVEVKVTGDLMGSREMSLAPLSTLKEKGVVFKWSRPLHSSSIFHSIQHRNHRRIVAIDQSISYIGGFNVGNEYIGKDKKLGHWTDTHVRLVGNNIEMAQQFKMDWEEDRGETKWKDSKVKSVSFESNKETSYQFLFTTGAELEQKMVSWIKGAKEDIWIATPYFMPSDALAAEMLQAAKRGVNIKVMVPKTSDAWFTQPPGYHRMEKLMNKNITWLEYTKGFLHSKIMIIDHDFVDVGTANWDPRSLYLNDESNCLLYGQEINQRFREVYLNNEQFATRITEQDLTEKPWWVKVLGKTPKDIQYYF
ncbi:phospholipase D-like domain-containing protein [Mangrovibacillus cuniculi]|uniref:PLD phosphodiesterase domain-containing protein n=1 Tax=Mangrovibacillus cuniculi TaxID=2593652 RepID=A0A7S8HEQ6_9BACI|nr:phospholipase D-like domain-containing protein [Mangrovibacillus cuniculi]QPC46114.1 hypothetical protein G8O30_03640 [Mangrovibacillus cuniculi]